MNALARWKMLQHQLQQQHRAAAQRSHFGQAGSAIGEKHAHSQRGHASDGRLRGVHHGREGHYRQGNIGHIIQKGLQKRAGNRAAQQRQRQHAHGIGNACRHQNIKQHVRHCAPPFWGKAAPRRPKRPRLARWCACPRITFSARVGAKRQS